MGSDAKLLCRNSLGKHVQPQQGGERIEQRADFFRTNLAEVYLELIKNNKKKKKD